MVNHHEAEWEWEGGKFKVFPGQTVTSIEKIAAKAGKGISTQNVRSALKRFEKFEFLTNKSTKTGRLITVLNWGLYQDTEKKPNKVPNKEVTKTQQRGNKEVTTNNNDNNDKKDKRINTIGDKSPLEIAIEEFKKMRKTIKKPMTDRAVELMLKDLDKLAKTDDEKVAILNQSIANSWQSVYPLKTNNTTNNSKTSYAKPSSFTEYQQRNVDFTEIEKQAQAKIGTETTEDWREKLKKTRETLDNKKLEGK